jgi:hypothetical protein
VVKSFITLGPGGSMGTRYVLQLLFGENRKITNNSVATNARDKIKQRFRNPQNFRNLLMYACLNLKTIKFY